MVVHVSGFKIRTNEYALLCDKKTFHARCVMVADKLEKFALIINTGRGKTSSNETSVSYNGGAQMACWRGALRLILGISPYLSEEGIFRIQNRTFFPFRATGREETVTNKQGRANSSSFLRLDQAFGPGILPEQSL